MPIKLDPARLDDGCGVEQTLRNNNAKYHQSGRLLFNNTKLERARKRVTTVSSTQEERDCKMVRKSPTDRPECFLCEEEAPPSELRHAMTMKLNERLHQCARTLNDGRLLAKL